MRRDTSSEEELDSLVSEVGTIGDRPRFSIFRISFKSAKLWPDPYSLAKKGNHLEEVLGRTSAAFFIT